MEHIVLSHVAKHLSANNFLLDSQHGFGEKLSSVTQLISSCLDWATTIQIDVVFHDFSKASDEVHHRRLSVKLSYYGINGPILTWINDFQRNRVQAVSVNGSHSTWGNATSAVPQGSVVGPALLLLYINDIKEKIQSNERLYADDTNVYREVNSINDHDHELHQIVNTLSNRHPPKILPTIYPSADLPSIFIKHFTNKVEKLRANIASEHVTSTLVTGTTAATFSSFEKVSQLTVKECILNSAPK